MTVILKHFVSIFILVVMLQTNNSFAQAASWQWARGAGSTGADQAVSTVVDASGSLYTIGWYTSAQLTFGSITLTNPGLGTSDIFVTKHDAAGNTLWAKTFGGADGDIGNGIVIDANGDVYITGWYASSTISFGSFTLTNSGVGSDVFTVKINSAGNTIWAKSGGGSSSSDRGNSIAVDATGNVFTTGGYMSSTANFGAVTLTNSASGINDLFIVKHDASGNVLWAKSAGGNATDIGNGVAVDPLGNAYITGFFASPTINFGAGTLTNTSSGTMDVFIVKYDASGNTTWSKQYGGSTDDQGNAIVVGSSALYVTGGFSSASINFTTTTLSNASAGTNDVFLTKLDLDGNVIWATRSGNIDSEAGTSIDMDSNGNIFIAGYFNSASLTFGASSLNNASSGYKDLFVTAYDATGVSLWAISAGDVFDEIANDISVNAAGNVIHIAGMYNSGMLSFGSHTLFKGCGDDVFIAKFNAPVVGIKEEYLENTILLYPNPATDKITIAAEGKIMFYNTLGESVLSINMEDRVSNEIDISSLPKGIYLCAIFSKQKVISKSKVVVK